MTARAKP